jgi:anti-sigma28 factor (negative regulator of flagellin synthesis)
MQIYGPFRVSTTQSAANVQSTSKIERGASASQSGEASGASASGPVDQLDLSQAATSANRIDGNSPVAGEGIRFERVAELRRQIADGSYDTPERLDAAMDRFLDLLG